MINYEGLTEQVFKKLDLGLESKDVVVDMPKAPQIGPDGQPIEEDPNELPPSPLDPELEAEINSLQSQEAMQLNGTY